VEFERGSQFRGKARNLSSDGRAVVEAENSKFIFFVEGAWPGDQGIFEVQSLEKKYGFARVVEIQKQSDDRRSAPCPKQGYEDGKCGGCPWMIGNYSSQLHFKVHRLTHALLRGGLIDDEKDGRLKKILEAPDEFRYRNRAQLKSDANKTGFLSTGSHTIVDVEECRVLNPKMQSLLTKLREQIQSSGVPRTGDHPFVFVDLDDDLDPNSPEPFVFNRRRPFRQGNHAQNFKMQNWLLQKITEFLPDSAKVLELYAGSGNLTKVLLQDEKIEKVLAIEVVDEALKNLQKLNPLRIEVLKKDLSRVSDFVELSKKLLAGRRSEARSVAQWDAIVLDPPREGAKGLDRLLSSLKTPHVFYISCDIASFVRDTSPFKKMGWKLESLTPLDLFPQTPHVEILSHFIKSS